MAKGKGKKGKGKHGNKGTGKLYNIVDPASGHNLEKLAKALTRAEVRPQQRAYQRLTNEIRGQSTADTLGLERLGKRTQKSLVDTATGFDKGSAAATQRQLSIGSQMQEQVARASEQAAQDLQQSQTGQLGGLQQAMALRGAPGGGAAQQQLQSLVSAQNTRQAMETQAAAAAASAQAGNYAGLSEGMRQANAMQAGAAQRDARRAISSRIAEGKLQAGADVREAQGRKADVKAQKADLFLKNLMEARGAERDYLLGRESVKTDRMSIRSSAQQAAADRASDEEMFYAGLKSEEGSAGYKGKSGDSAPDHPNAGKKKRRRAYQTARDVGNQIISNSGDTSWLQNHPVQFVEDIQDKANVKRGIARAMAKKYYKKKGIKWGG